MKSRLVVGCMTGTSLDGLDVALVRIHGEALAMRAEILAGSSRSFEGTAFAVPLRDLASGVPASAKQIANIAREFSEFHAAVVREALDHAGEASPDLVCVHGQTVFHAPPGSWQLFNPWPLAASLKAPVVFDLRGADIAKGGQGAPITPLADWVLFRKPGERVTVVNLGGFCNYTWLPAGTGDRREPELDEIRAGDVCACNHVLDGVARELLGEPFDAAGSRAASGVINEEAATDLCADLDRQSRVGRSLGTGDESFAWIERWRLRLSPEDVARSAVEGVARVIGGALPACERVYLAGGGKRHTVLASRLTARIGAPVHDSSEAGVPGDYREAMCMAVLGALCQDRVPITLPQVTGVPQPAPVAGCWVYQ